MAGNAMSRERLFALRETIARIEGKPLHEAREAAQKAAEDLPSLSDFRSEKGGEDILSLLREVGSPDGSFVEIRSARFLHAGAASGFALALAAGLGQAPSLASRVLLIGDRHVARETGLTYAPGLADFGLRPGELIHALPRRIEDALWLTDAALSCNAFGAVIFEMHGNSKRFGLTESRRLSLKARKFANTLIVLRQGGEEEASSASLRFRAEAHPAALRLLAGRRMPETSIGNPVFRITVEKSRLPVLSEFLLEWNSHERRLLPVPSSAFQQSSHSIPQLSAAFDGPDRPVQMGSLLAFDRAS